LPCSRVTTDTRGGRYSTSSTYQLGLVFTEVLTDKTSTTFIFDTPEPTLPIDREQWKIIDLFKVENEKLWKLPKPTNSDNIDKDNFNYSFIGTFAGFANNKISFLRDFWKATKYIYKSDEALQKEKVEYEKEIKAEKVPGYTLLEPQKMEAIAAVETENNVILMNDPTFNELNQNIKELQEKLYVSIELDKNKESDWKKYGNLHHYKSDQTELLELQLDNIRLALEQRTKKLLRRNGGRKHTVKKNRRRGTRRRRRN